MATEEKSWTVDIEHKVKDFNPLTVEKLWKNASIYTVPPFVRDLNDKAFSPQMVSFGPYHHGESHLKPMEVHKERALIHFLLRAGRPLDEFVSAARSVVQQLQDSYYRLDDKWRDEHRFLKLMIVDGCFMLEVLQFNPKERGWYSSDDPFFSQHGIHHKMPYIRRDMLMIENQIPLLLLKKLLAVKISQTCVDDDYINKLVLKFVAGEGAEAGTIKGPGLHALDLFRQSCLQFPPSRTQEKQPLGCLQFPPPRTQERQPLTPLPLGITITIRTAVELREAGVQFKKSPTNSLKDISFHKGTLSLPALVVDDATECTLLNILVFEHLHVSAGNEVTSYVSFMDEIIDSAKDVSLLQSKGIIQNALGSDEAVAKLFNTLSKDVTLDLDSSLRDVRRQVNRYCQRRSKRWKAYFMHNYFRNPWSFLSLAGALLIIVLTISQTVFSILDYYKPS